MTTISSAPPRLPGAAALFLDFDGTLVPIAPRPQDICVPGWVLPTLQRLQAQLRGALAVVSGRPLADLDRYLAPWRPIAVGAHGAERRDATGHVVRRDAQPPAAVLAVALALAERHGLIVERKVAGFTVHYRQHPELESICRNALFDAFDAEPQAHREWAWLQGHCVLELKPRGVSKGAAVRRLMREAPFADRLPVFVGDDVTDEDGILAVQEHGGFGVRVGAGPSAARHRLPDVDAVGRWLRTPPREPGAASPDTAPGPRGSEPAGSGT